MNAFRLGPFEALEKIAMGGMGDVWRGRHAVQDVPVAIKVIRRNSSDILNFLSVFRREVRAVAQLDHPSIITLFDIGEVSESVAAESDGELDAGSPYLVMEYLERGSLETLDFPLPWSQTHDVLVAVLDGLAHAHARGITHRDLKPGNILLAGGASESPVKLTDFGIAFSFSESQSKETEGRAIGTPTHMSPEQFLGEWRNFGPWTDLYALGCVAYQLASGNLPFTAVDLMQLGTAHIKDRPPDLDCPPDYPDGFSRWVMQLLEKDPEYRYRRSADAAEALNAIARSPAPGAYARQSAAQNRIKKIPDWRTFSRDRSPFRLVGTGIRLFGFRPVPIVDRGSERDLLWETYKQVSATGQTRCTVLEGPAGTGKSRLAEWFCELTHELGIADCLKAGFNRTGSRETALSHMLASAWSCLNSDEVELRHRVEGILATTNLLSRTSRDATTEFLAPAALGHDYRPGMFYEFRAQSRRFAVLLEALSGVYSHRPLVLWLEDVHYGVEGLQFVRYVLEKSNNQPQPMMFVVTVRDDLIVDSRLASELFHTLCEKEAVGCRRLGPLSPSDSRTLVNKMLYLEGDLAESIRLRSGGNPLYATQLVGDWVSRGILEAGTTGFVLSGSHRPSIPDDVHSVWVQRLERVLDESVDQLLRYPSPSEQRLQMQLALELAAALGGRVDLNEWRSVSSAAGVPDPFPVLDILLAYRLAQTGDGSWSFSHSMLRDSVERIAREKGRWTTHNRLCAEMLQRRRPVPYWGDSEREGRYRFEAEQYESAIGPLLRGARERTRLEEYAAALELVDLCDRAIAELGLPKADQIRLEGLLLRASIKCTRREFVEAAELAAQLRTLAAAEFATRYVGAALLVLAKVEQQQGTLRSAVDRYVEAEAILRTTGPEHELAACLSEKASALMDLGMLARAWDAFNEAQEIYEDTGRLFPWAQNQLGLARVALRQGNPEHAMTLCRRVRNFARREELNHLEATAAMVLAEIQMAEGETDLASESLDRSIGLFEQLGLFRQELHPRLLKVLILLESSSIERARSELAHLRSGPDVGAPWISVLLMACIGLALDVDGPRAEFHASAREVSGLISETEVLPPDVMRCFQLAVERAIETGHPERAVYIRTMGTQVTAGLGRGEQDLLVI